MFRERILSPADDEYLSRVRATLGELEGADAAQGAETYARHLLERGLPVLFDDTHLSFVTGVPRRTIAYMRSYPDRFYSEFRIGKRDGGSRPIRAPKPSLRAVQQWIARNVLTAYEPHPCCHGFVRGRSVVTNATPHVGKPRLFKADLSDFFGSIPRSRVFGIFRRAGYSPAVANLLADLTTLDGRLPQGAPTSPALANVAAFTLDCRLAGLARRHDISYTRYADDLTFSGVLAGSPRLRRTIFRIIHDEDFRVNEHKTRLVGRNRRQLVTGVVVNDVAHWPRWRRRWLRQEIYYLRRFGIDDHMARRGVDKSFYKEFVYGHVYALNQLHPEEARSYLEVLDAIDWPY